MKVFLLDNKQQTVNIWKLFFAEEADVEPVCDDFKHFMDNTDVECVVSPANSYGLMDGGYDLAISEWFGWDLAEKAQAYILEHYRGEQPVGSSFIIDSGVKGIKLIHTPTMRIPSIMPKGRAMFSLETTTMLPSLWK